VSVIDFYDQLSPFYHLIYPDWEQSISRQARELDAVIRELWGNRVQEVLDAACGVGTQAIGLAQLGYKVTACDISSAAVERAKVEAIKRGLNIAFSVADMRELSAHYDRPFDLIIACDNAVPHLLSDAEIGLAFREFHRCTKSSGGCMLSVRDYAAIEIGGTQVIPYGIREKADRRYLLVQVWEFDGPVYELSLYVVEDRGDSEATVQVMRTKYYAVSADRLIELMGEAGYSGIRRLDGRFFQPLIVGTKTNDQPGR
jgi:SAM-dependent methyltransferase